MLEKFKNKVFVGAYDAGETGLGVLVDKARASKKEFTSFYLLHDNKWEQHSFDFYLNSLTYFKDISTNKEGWWLIGKCGEVVFINNNNSNITKIKTAGTGVLEENEIIELVPFNSKNVTTLTLHSTNNLLWSIGETDLIFYNDSEWKAIK